MEAGSKAVRAPAPVEPPAEAGSEGICVVGASRKTASGSEKRSGDEVGISVVAS